MRFWAIFTPATVIAAGYWLASFECELEGSPVRRLLDGSQCAEALPTAVAACIVALGALYGKVWNDWKGGPPAWVVGLNVFAAGALGFVAASGFVGYLTIIGGATLLFGVYPFAEGAGYQQAEWSTGENLLWILWFLGSVAVSLLLGGLVASRVHSAASSIGGGVVGGAASGASAAIAAGVASIVAITIVVTIIVVIVVIAWIYAIYFVFVAALLAGVGSKLSN